MQENLQKRIRVYFAEKGTSWLFKVLFGKFTTWTSKFLSSLTINGVWYCLWHTTCHSKQAFYAYHDDSSQRTPKQKPGVISCTVLNWNGFNPWRLYPKGSSHTAFLCTFEVPKLKLKWVHFITCCLTWKILTFSLLFNNLYNIFSVKCLIHLYIIW